MITPFPFSVLDPACFHLYIFTVFPLISKQRSLSMVFTLRVVRGIYMNSNIFNGWMNYYDWYKCLWDLYLPMESWANIQLAASLSPKHISVLLVAKGRWWKEPSGRKKNGKNLFFFFFLRWFRDSDQNKVILIHFYQRWQLTCLLFTHFFFGFPFLFVRFFKYILLIFPGKMFLCFRD